MHIRRNITALTAACVGLAVLAACVAAYVAVRSELYDQIDRQLDASRFVAVGPPPGVLPAGASAPAPMQVANGVAVTGLTSKTLFFQRFVRDPGPRRGGPPGYVQLVRRGGDVVLLRGGVKLPVSARIRAMARTGKGATAPRTETVGGARVRVVSFAVPSVGALVVGRSLDATDHVLSRLRAILVVVLLAGVALAAFLARRVGGRFGAVLGDLERTNAALDASVIAQRQLVADASHELRTPVTSLRTNVEVLLEGGELDPETRRQLLDDVHEQTEELSALVADVIELARGDAQDVEPQDVRLDQLATEAVERARRHAPRDVTFALHAEPVAVQGVPERLGRAVNNLLDNAARHAPPGSAVEVAVDARGITVRDHGPGVDPSETAQLFDRFHRGPGEHGRAGSGLGLAIVRQVAESHGGSATVANAPDGGAVFSLQLPTFPPEPVA